MLSIQPQHRSAGPDLFGNSSPLSEHSSSALSQAVHHLQQFADRVYTGAGLKPLSKALFFLSRALLASTVDGPTRGPDDLLAAYRTARASLGDAAPPDDYAFETIVTDCGPILPELLAHLNAVKGLTRGQDALGLAFDTLLRGKWEGGEGLGTYLTPEEVVRPMVSMAFTVRRRLTSGVDGLYGDICGGTGRFAFAISRFLRSVGSSPEQVRGQCRLFDQSSLAVGLAQVNFTLDGVPAPAFAVVDDSLTNNSVTALAGQFALLATNPPFGASKYPWRAELTTTLDRAVLRCLGMLGPGNAADPSVLFFFRNCSLLAEQGVLAIVLPDGVLYSARFSDAWATYEQVHGTRLNLHAAVSLPVAAFALGGTVAKTSFLILSRDSGQPRPGLFVSAPLHIGFLKRGNRRAPDPKGNHLDAACAEFSDGCPGTHGRVAGPWVPPSCLKQHIAATATGEIVLRSQHARSVGSVASIRRTFAEPLSPAAEARQFHISVLDVDETGLIDVRAAASNTPQSRGLACYPNDVLLSCLNPKIWRVCLIPDIGVRWTCSPEFVVLTVLDGRILPEELAILLQHPHLKTALCALATGTSSSRQRVPKDRILQACLPELKLDAVGVASHFTERQHFYRCRLAEVDAYSRLRGGAGAFIAINGAAPA